MAAADATGCCWNPFCRAPLRNKHMHFCEHKRHCQLMRCLVLSGQNLPTTSRAAASSPAHLTAASAMSDAFVIPKRKLQPVSPVTSIQPTSNKSASSKKRLLADTDVSVVLKWPRVANPTANPALPKAKAKKELIKQVVSSNKHRQASLQSNVKQSKTTLEPTHVRLYDVSGFRGAHDLDPKYLQELFSLYRARKGKTMVAPKDSLANSWMGFMKAWNKDRLEYAIGPRALLKSCAMVHRLCDDRQLPFCYAHLIDPGKCPECGPSAPPYSHSPLNGASNELFEAPVFQNHLALRAAIVRRKVPEQVYELDTTSDSDDF